SRVRVRIHAVGRMKAGAARELTQRYLDRFGVAGKGLGLHWSGLIEIREGRSASLDERRQEESAQLLRWLEEGRVVVLLDERGKQLDSMTMARQIGAWRDGGATECIFAIGGPDGHDPAVLANASLAISFGRMTWPHQLCRIMLAE